MEPGSCRCSVAIPRARRSVIRSSGYFRRRALHTKVAEQPKPPAEHLPVLAPSANRQQLGNQPPGFNHRSVRQANHPWPMNPQDASTQPRVSRLKVDPYRMRRRGYMVVHGPQRKTVLPVNLSPERSQAIGRQATVPLPENFQRGASLLPGRKMKGRACPTFPADLSAAAATMMSSFTNRRR